jgi:hypothetical protein
MRIALDVTANSGSVVLYRIGMVKLGRQEERKIVDDLKCMVERAND